MSVEQSLFKAIKLCGNKQKNLAAAIGESPDKIRYWLNKCKRVPFHNAIAIEKVTDGQVSRFDLAPYARSHRNINSKHKFIQINSQEIRSDINSPKEERILEAEQKYKLPLRLILTGLKLYCCEQNLFLWHTEQLKNKLLPFVEINFDKVLEALTSNGFIQKIKKGNSVYGQIL